jgi:hypothetical protein
MLGEPPLAAVAGLGLEPIDEVGHVKEEVASTQLLAMAMARRPRHAGLFCFISASTLHRHDGRESGKLPAMCNAYLITTNQATIATLFWVTAQHVGNLANA